MSTKLVVFAKKKEERMYEKLKLESLLLLVHCQLQPQTTDTKVCQKRSELGQSKMDRGFYHLKNVLRSSSYLLPLASKTSFTEWYAKPSQAPTLICLPCFAILACSKVGTWD